MPLENPELGRGAHRIRTVGEAWGSWFRHERCGGTGRKIVVPETVGGHPRSAGGRLSAITPKAIVASDFLVAITAGFRVLCVFVVMEVEVGAFCSAMSRPSRLQPGPCSSFRQAMPSDHGVCGVDRAIGFDS